MWVELTNLDPGHAANIELSVSGANLTRAQGQVLAAPRFDSVNTFEAPGVVSPKPLKATAAGKRLSVKLPPASVSVLALE